MLDKINQSNSTVSGDQIAGNKVVNNYPMEISRELVPATDPIRIYGDEEKDSDHDNTVLIRKLRAGEFNKSLIDHAIKSKASYLKEQMTLLKTAEGKGCLNDIQANLSMLINSKYVSQMNEGDTLKISLGDMINDFSAIVKKYKNIITIDEAFVEGMLYAITSECAINWRIEGFDDES